MSKRVYDGSYRFPTDRARAALQSVSAETKLRHSQDAWERAKSKSLPTAQESWAKSNRAAALRARASRQRLPQFTMALPKPTLHTCNNGLGPDFGRLTQGCPRCEELRAGAPARSGRNARRF